jgi:hypothetical protein
MFSTLGEALDVIHRFQPGLLAARVLRFWQFGLDHAVRASAGGRLDGFVAPGFSRYAVVPFGFRFQVSLVAQEYHAQLLPCYTGINSSRDAAHIVGSGLDGARKMECVERLQP